MLAQGALVQTALVDIPRGTAGAAPVFINGWYVRFTDPPVRTKRGLKASQQLFRVAAPYQPTVSFGWFKGLSEPIRFPRRLKSGLQQTLAPSPNPIVSFGWMAPLSVPRDKTKPGLKPSNQIAVFYHPRPIISIPWWQMLAEPTIKTKLGLRASQQQFLAQPPRLLPTANITGVWYSVETGDTALFGGIQFGRPVSAQVSLPVVTGTNWPVSS